MSRGITVRPSQFVFNYGVGSILEAPNGPRIVLDFDKWGGLFNSPNLSAHLSNTYEVPEPYLSALLENGKIFRLPTNSDLLENDDTPIFTTGLFPKWAHCQQHNTVFQLKPDGRTRCPDCNPNRYSQDQAMRFVRACSRGHLDDVAWEKVVHSHGENCSNTIFRWIEHGSTLSDIRIKCEKCNAEIKLSQVYYGKFFCSGKVAENGKVEQCNEMASVVLRNASNLRVPIIESVITIPPRDTSLGRILENPHLHSIFALSLQLSWNKTQIVTNLESIKDSTPGLGSLSIEEIKKTPEKQLLKMIKETVVGKVKLDSNLTPQKVRNDEFDALKEAAITGHPPQPDKKFHDFEVDKDAVKVFPISDTIDLRITPINRLRAVIAQKGYKRIIGDGPHKLRKTSLRLGKETWYLGMSLHGEGIFIDLPPQKTLNIIESSKQWFSEFKRKKDFRYHPIFVWWHTLSHRIIKALALDSGYSSASIRERLYLKYDEDFKTVDGGILLFTSQRGGDGTLGGLIALVPEFNRVLRAALRNINGCSNDPLCQQQTLQSNRKNGAACYACLYLSETSCEFGNLYLDRNVLRRSLI